MTDKAQIYIGPAEALQSEIGLLECYVGIGTWIVAVFRADGAEFDPIGCDTREEAEEVVADNIAYLATLGEEAHVNWVH